MSKMKLDDSAARLEQLQADHELFLQAFESKDKKTKRLVKNMVLNFLRFFFKLWVYINTNNFDLLINEIFPNFWPFSPFSEPTQIYRYLRTRNLISVRFLNINEWKHDLLHFCDLFANLAYLSATHFDLHAESPVEVKRQTENIQGRFVAGKERKRKVRLIKDQLWIGRKRIYDVDFPRLLWQKT